MPMFLQMQNLTRESRKLADMRDAILPQLMSGELDVSSLDL
jgi:type I restriction enzyme S subunit